MHHKIFTLLTLFALAACDGGSSQKGDGNREAADSTTEDSTDNPTSLIIEGLASCRYAMGAELALCINIPVDASAEQLAEAEAACDPSRGYQWQEEACPTVNAIGGCDKAAGGRNFGAGILQYYYNPPFQAADAQGMCEANGGSFQ
ncbi:MAG: hypothetical protein ACOH5I_16965 [Oligoflexus sp.]